MEEEIDIKDLIYSVWRKKWLIIAVTLLFLIIGGVLVKIGFWNDKKVEPVKEPVISDIYHWNDELVYVQTDFMLGRGKDVKIENTEAQATYKLNIDNRILSNLNEFIMSKQFLESALQEVNYNRKISFDEIKNDIMIISNGSSDVLTLIVGLEDENACKSLSEKILNELTEKVNLLYQVEQIIKVDGPITLEQEEAQDFFYDLNETALASVVQNEPQNDVEEENDKSTSPKKKVMLLTVVGFVLSCGGVVVVEIFNNSIKKEESLEKITGLKTLTKLPKSDTDLSERFKILKVNLNEAKTILVTSPEVGDGKSFVALNLAKTYTKFGKKVLLVDLVNNSSNIVKKYDGHGLVEYLTSNDNSTSNYVCKTSVDNLDVLFAGKNLSNLPELLDGYKMKDTLKLLENLYDVIIIDSGNVLQSASTLTVAKNVRYTILVVAERKTKIENIVRAKNDIEDVGGTVVGTVYNNSMKK